MHNILMTLMFTSLVFLLLPVIQMMAPMFVWLMKTPPDVKKPTPRRRYGYWY